MKFLKSENFILFSILFLFFFLYTWKIGDIVFVDEDEAIYAQVASEMVQSGDWLNPHMNFKAFNEKQPLVYWFLAVSFILFGKNEFAVRFWHCLISVAGLYILYLTGKELFDKFTGLLSSVIFGTFLFYFYQSRSPLMDIPLTVFILLSLYFFIRFIKSSVLLYNYLFWISTGLAVMTKGLVGIVLPCGIIVFFLIFTKRLNLRNIKNYGLHILFGFFVFVLIALPWHIIEFYHYGWAFIDTMFVGQTFRRYITGLGGKSQSPSFFTHLITILYGSLPWSGFLLPSILLLLRKRDDWGRSEFLIIWFFTVFIFFSISADKRIRYILPLFPCLALWISYLWSCYLKSDEQLVKKYMKLSSIFSFPLGLLILGAIVYGKMKFPDEFDRFAPFCVFPLIIFAVGIILSAIIILFNRKKIAFISFTIFSLITYFFLVKGTAEYFNQARPIKIFAQIINSSGEHNYDAACFMKLYPSLIFYTNHRVEDVGNREDLAVFLSLKKRVFCTAERVDLNPEEFEKVYNCPVFILKEQAGYLLISNKKD